MAKLEIIELNGKTYREVDPTATATATAEYCKDAPCLK